MRSTLFTDAMALGRRRRVSTASSNEHWTIGPKVHGGAMLALCANAARAIGAQRPGDRTGVEPIAVSGNFLWAPDPGPMQVVTTVRKRGRRVSLVDVELQAGRPHRAVRAAMTLGEPEHDVAAAAVGQSGGAADDAGAAARTRADRAGPPDGRHRAPGPRLRHPAVADDDRTPRRRRAAGHRVLGAAQGAAPDVLFALLCGDVSAPVTFGVNRFGWAPTVQLTAYLRALPADGWLRVLCTTMQIGQDWFDEDHIVVDCEGRIIVQSRQLALVPRARRRAQ